MKNDTILSEIRVLDLSQYIAGPYTAKLLADNGAEVIKVEPPGEGDIARKYGPFPNDIPDRETSGLFLSLNTSKKGVTLDITRDKGKEVFLNLVDKVDMLVESFVPSFLPSLGLGYNDLSRLNPRLVMTSITNFGQSGPYREWEATEIGFQASGGLMTITGEPRRPPLKVGIPLAQYLSGLTGFTSTLAAVFHAQNTGEGQHVDIAICEAIPPNIDDRALAWSLDYSEKPLWSRTGERRGPLIGIYQCQDGFIGCTIPNFSYLKRLADTISPELANEKRFGDYFWGWTCNPEELEAVLVPWFYEHKRQELMDMAQSKGLPWGYVATIQDVAESNPHLKERGSLIDLEHPKAGKQPYFIPCNRFSGIKCRMFAAPLLGQHNKEIFNNLLGMSDDELAELASEGII